MPSPRSLLATIALFVGLSGGLAACAPSLDDQIKQAQASLDAGDGPAAEKAAATALKDAKAPKDAWRLELIRAQGLAQQGKGADVLTHVERLAGAYPKNVTAPLYRDLADKLRASKDTAGAIELLAAGDARFPAEHQSFVDAIAALKEAGVDPEELERLKALGYL